MDATSPLNQKKRQRKHTLKQATLFFSILFTASSSLSYDKLEKLKNKEGYVLLPLMISGATPRTVILKSQSLFGENYRFDNIKTGMNYRIIKLPVGKYKWSRIKLNSRYYFDLKDENYLVIVKENTINYSGHLAIDINDEFGTAQYKYVNRSTQAMVELNSCCSSITSLYPTIYTGDFEDPFINYYEKILSEGRR